MHAHLVSMPMLNANMTVRPLSRELRMREAVLLTFCDPLPQKCSLLRKLSGRQWRKLLRWLDVSGLALYFLDRMVELQQCDSLPAAVLARLRRNLADNTERTRGLIEESNAIHREFQAAGFPYATLKGFSFWPCSVPKPELRSQLDLDFLVTEENAPEARRILEGRGYCLRAVSGGTWEFKTNQIHGTTLKDLYKNHPLRSVELHIQDCLVSRPQLLARAQKRFFHGIDMPVLSPVDLFIGQGLHIFKHLCGEFLRPAHMVEFRRNVLAHRDDEAFWAELRSVAGDDSRTALGLGIVTLLIAQTMGEFAPDQFKSWTTFKSWTVDRLPASIQLWVLHYGHRAVLANFPGSKLYLLLRSELASPSMQSKRTLQKSLLPLSLPPLLAHASERETLRERIRRRRVQLHFILFRLRFHAVEGIRYMVESARWRVIAGTTKE